MKQVLFFAGFLFSFLSGWSQRYDVDRKTGLMTLEGVPHCYIQPIANKEARQFMVRNLQKQDLILVTENEGRHLDRTTQSMQGNEFRFVFLQTHGWCTTNSSGLSYNNYMRIAKILVREKMIVGDAISASAERDFIRKNDGVAGTITAPPATTPASVAQPATATAAAPPGLRIEGDKAFLGTRLLGSFSSTRITEDKVTIYGTDDLVIAVATRPITGGDWTIETREDNKKVDLRYYADNSIQRLFQFLLDKKYMK